MRRTRPARGSSESEWLASTLPDIAGGDTFRERELETRLDEFVAVAQRVLDGAGVGLMLLGAEEELWLVSASSEAGRALEHAQHQTGEGPGMLATRARKVVAVNDLAEDGRWPHLGDAVIPLGVVSTLSAPMWLGDRPLGSLDLFDTVQRRWSPADCETIAIFAGALEALLRIEIASYRNGQRIVELRERLADDLGAGGDPDRLDQPRR